MDKEEVEKTIGIPQPRKGGSSTIELSIVVNMEEESMNMQGVMVKMSLFSYNLSL